MQRVAKHLYRRGNSYEFFRRVPPDARHLFGGKTAVSVSFGDVALRKADHLAAALRRETDSLIAAARKKPDPTIGPAHRRLPIVPTRAEMDRAVRAWVTEQTDKLTAAGQKNAKDAAGKKNRQDVVRQTRLMATLVQEFLRESNQAALLPLQWVTETLVARHDWVLGLDEADYLADRVGRAQREILSRVSAELNFDDTPAPTHRMFDPTAFAMDQAHVDAPPPVYVPIMDVLDRYAAERQPQKGTIKKWRTALTSLTTFLGHDDASRVQQDDILRWKDHLLATDADGVKSRGQATVRDGYVGAVKPVFGWATANKLIATNPASGVAVSVPKRQVNRPERGYTDDEAKVVLKAATNIDVSDGSFLTFAIRWLPWLAAYTGARIRELAQLRTSDVGKTPTGIWFITITPEAGSQKGGFARQVALHPHLIEQGFVDALKGRHGPIFYDPSNKKEGSTGNSQASKVGQRVASWVRSIGINDPELQPNHGWRHRFATFARHVGMPDDIQRTFMGHAAKDVHAGYGNTLVITSYEYIRKFPRFNVTD